MRSALVAGAVSLGGHYAAAEPITMITTGTNNPIELPIMGGEAKGYFKEAGIELEMFGAQSTAAAMQQLAAGSGHMATGGLTDPLYAIDKGAKIALLRILAQVPPYTLWAKPNIKSFADLRGKLVMVGGAKDITRIYYELMVTPNGLKKGDYDFIYAGTTPARFAALQSGGVDASILLPPFSFKAEGLGFSLVGRLSDYVKDLPFTALAVSVDWARTRKPLVTNFMKAYRRGVEWFYDDNNRAEAIQILINRSRAAPADAAATYDYFRSIQVFGLDGAITPESIGTMAKILAESGDLTSGDPQRYINPEFAGLR
jgi:ABC-type nitrate/sulfonate/bicarbonate transport system substrate-binding protein